ncbi:ESX secretion-associated protein EspG [Amycolatopsis granulosa]|uniref:ESX secretion-associated protein EspG n=1 Tax=Amycolatopsis granulosa TaxID=185684 RepID=UPI001420E300|nr:hypothetical protein [Amycolatopsis granulosa]
MLNQPLKLTTPLLIHLIKRRGAEPHNTLSAMPVWHDETNQRLIDEGINAALTEHGLMGPRGMDREFAAVIESIARPHVEFYGWFEGTFPDRPSNFTVFTGSGPGGGFVLARFIEENGVLLLPERPERVLPAFIEQIPPAPPGGSARLVAPKSEVLGHGRARDEGPSSIMQAAPGRAVQSPAAEIKRILAAPRTGGGSLYAAVRNRAGVRRRCARPLNFIDIAEGRWLMEERPGGGEPEIVLTPATAQGIGQWLHNAATSLG